MIFAEQKLAVQIADINRVQVDHINVLKACHRETLDKFTTDPTCANDQHSGYLDNRGGVWSIYLFEFLSFHFGW